MARIRTIKPEFWTDEAVVECSTEARLLFIGMWNFADDAGRMELSPKRIKMQIFPGDDFASTDILGMIDELCRNGLLIRYAVDDKDLLQIKGWRHQRIDRAQPPKYPGPDKANSTKTPDLFDDCSSTEKEGKGKDSKKEPTVPKKRKSRLPDECPSVHDQEKALAYWKQHNVAADLSIEVDSFRTHHLGKGTLALDWSATWQTWYVNQRKYCREVGSPKGRPIAFWSQDETVAPQQEVSSDDVWRNRVKTWSETGTWSQSAFASEPPDSPFTSVPEHILKEFGLGKVDA